MSEDGNKAIMFDGDAYEKNHGQWSRAVARQFVDWLDQSEGLQWLDVGCGTGAAGTTILAGANPSRVVGIDPSASQVAYAASHVSDDRAHFQVGTAMSLDFNDGEFDVVMSGLVLNLVPDAVHAIGEMKRVAKPSGVVATYIWDIADDGHPASPLVNGFSRLDPDAPRFGGGGRSIESEQDIRQLFEEGGISDISTTRIEITVQHPSFEAYWDDALISQGPPGAYLKKMSNDGLARLKKVLAETVPTNANGGVAYPASAWAIRGTP